MLRLAVDVLVAGAGLAGLTTALGAARRAVTVLSPSGPPAGTASAMAQGGLAAAVGENDSPALHAADTLRAGAGDCDARAVYVLCTEAASAIRWLEKQGVHFERCARGWAVHREAAHARARVLHVDDDRTGAALIDTLARVARSRSNIELLSGYTLVALTGEAGIINGAVALDESDQPVLIEARATVLATGGLGQLFLRTTNPSSACGDGLGMALAAGAHCIGLELVQFHPTALDVDADPLPLVTEALRGAGAVLQDVRGRRFMRAAHPAGDLAPRDVVAREVWKQACSAGRAYLDATEVFRRQPHAFPGVRDACGRYGIDPGRQPLPVVPAAHSHMGGIAVDLEGRSSLEHLWACGEVACTGVHGANRLASNSLLEAVVFGRRVGRALAAADAGAPQGGNRFPRWMHERVTRAVDAQAWRALRDLMWADLGILREASSLTAGLAMVERLAHAAPDRQILLRHRLRLARTMLAAALARTESRGAHFRVDCRAPAARAGEW